MNAQSIYSVFELDTKDASKFIIVPSTHKVRRARARKRGRGRGRGRRKRGREEEEERKKGRKKKKKYDYFYFKNIYLIFFRQEKCPDFLYTFPAKLNLRLLP